MIRTSWNRAEHPPYTYWRTACIALLATGVLHTTTRAQILAAREFYAQAIAMPAASAESRAEQLYQALRLAQSCSGRSGLEKSLTAKIKKSLSELDPRALTLLKIKNRGASQTLRAAQKLVKIGRPRSAAELVNLSLALAPAVDCKAVEAIRSQQPTANALLLDFFAEASLPYFGDSWVISAAGITSPPPQRRGQNVTTMLQSSSTLIGNYKLSIEARTSIQSSEFGIALGIKGKGKSYQMLTLVLAKDASRIALDRFAKNSFEELAVQPVRLEALGQDDWLEIEISVENRRISASVNGSAPLVVEAQTDLDGALGFFLAADNHNSMATSFRNMRIECLR